MLFFSSEEDLKSFIVDAIIDSEREIESLNRLPSATWKDELVNSHTQRVKKWKKIYRDRYGLVEAIAQADGTVSKSTVHEALKDVSKTGNVPATITGQILQFKRGDGVS